MVATRSQLTVSLASLAFATGLALTAPAAAQYGTIPPWSTGGIAVAPTPAPAVDPQWQAWDPAYALPRAESHAAPGGDRVLRTAESMIDAGTVVRGSCYDWVDAVFTRAAGTRHDAFHGGMAHGPYAQVQDFQPGDWVLFVNGEYEGELHTHSAIFVGWADETQRVAVMMSYAGSRRDEPGRFGTYELSRAYRIIRLSDEVPAPRTRRAHRAPSPHGHHRGHG